MNLAEVIDLLDSSKNSHGIIPKRKFNTLFKILPADDDGNCLFYSIEQLHSEFDFSELRNAVCEYYKNFGVMMDLKILMGTVKYFSQKPPVY